MNGNLDVVDSLLLPLFVGVLFLVLVLLFNISCPSFAIILMQKRGLDALLLTELPS